MIMKEFKDIDLYLLLETTQNASKDDIKKAYRKKALKCHPDKNPNNPHATKIFHQLQHALAILIDDAARKAYDSVLKARKTNELKNSQLDEKRKRAKQQLEERESKCKIYSKTNHNSKSEEEVFTTEIERLMKEGYIELEEERKKIQNEIEKNKILAENKKSTTIQNINNTKIKVSWKTDSEWRPHDNNVYSPQSLRMIFSKYGDVKEVVLSESRTPRKGSALIEMNLGHCAEMAVKMERGFCGNPLKLKLISETTAPHSIRSEAKIEDSATQTTSKDHS